MCSKHVTLILLTILDVFANITIIKKGTLPLIKDSVGIKLFIDIVNEDRSASRKIISGVRKCCLYDAEFEDCDMVVYGEAAEIIRPKDRKTFIYVYPTIYQHDQVGYCDIYLYYEYRKPYQINIPFDTRININNNEHYLINQKAKICEALDLNPLDNCLPVECDLKYNGRKTYFDNNTNKCIKPPACVDNIDNDIPNVMYNPNNNKCQDCDVTLTVQDIYEMSTGNTLKRSVKSDEHIKIELVSNCSTISQNLCFLRDLINGKFCPLDNDFSKDCKLAFLRIVMCVISICAILFTVIGFLNLVIAFYSHWSSGDLINSINMIRSKLRKNKPKETNSGLDSQVRNMLLRQVIEKDVPLELRDNFMSICERVEKEVQRRRYRNLWNGSQTRLYRKCDTSSSSSIEDK